MGDVIPRLIRFVALVLTGLVAISFLTFVADEMNMASGNATERLMPTGPGEAVRRDRHGRLADLQRPELRSKYDEAADALTGPGESLGRKFSGGDHWAMRSGAFIFGLALYFIGLSLLARWIALSRVPGRSLKSPTTID